MACANPLSIKNPHFDKTGRKGLLQYTRQYYTVPCGWCLNCRVDKRNYLKDCLNYEYNKYGCGAFVTFTYDDYHINPNLKRQVDGSVLPSLNRSDYVHFLYRLRSRIRHSGISSKLCNPRFKYLVVGEYGENFTNRCHFHIIFLGLDWLACEKLFLDSWKNGIIDSLPIKDGCFDYVLKYLDKQVHGSEAEEMYDNKGLERPFHSHSVGLGSGLYLEQLDYIKSHNYCYVSEHRINRPLPIYWRNKLFGSVTPDYNRTMELMKSYNIRGGSTRNIHYYSLKQMNEFRHKQAMLRAENIYQRSLAQGVPSFKPIDNDSFSLDELDFGKMATVALNTAYGVPF